MIQKIWYNNGQIRRTMLSWDVCIYSTGYISDIIVNIFIVYRIEIMITFFYKVWRNIYRHNQICLVSETAVAYYRLGNHGQKTMQVLRCMFI